MDIIERLKKGDQAIFLSVLKKHNIQVFRFFYKKLQDVEIAKELTQQCFIRLWEYRRSLSEDFVLERQLFAVAKSLLLNHLKKENSHSNLKKRLSEINDGTDQQVPYSLSSAHHFEQRDFINTALDRLPKTQKQILQMKFITGYTNKEIADQLSISIKTVEWHINKAYHQLRDVVHSI